MFAWCCGDTSAPGAQTLPEAVEASPMARKLPVEGEAKFCAADKEPPTPPSAGVVEGKTFEVSLGEVRGDLGLKCDFWERCIQVVSVGSGALQDYNESTLENCEKVLQYDFITKVDGETDVNRMTASLVAGAVTSLRILRAAQQRVTMARDASTPWGLRLTYEQRNTRDCICLHVSEVGEGACRLHNQTTSRGDQVKEHDYVAAVNGVSGSAKQLHEELKAATTLEMTLLRLPPEEVLPC